jgi:hypothetical protein
MKKVFYLIEQLGKLLHMYDVPVESYGLRKKFKTLKQPLQKNYTSAGTNYLNFFGFYVDK